MLFWPRPNMLRFSNRCRILKTIVAKGPSCTGVMKEIFNQFLFHKKIFLNESIEGGLMLILKDFPSEFSRPTSQEWFCPL